MPKELVISAAPHETRVAILEDGLALRNLHRTGKRICVSRKHLQRPRDARAARHAVGLRGDRPR